MGGGEEVVTYGGIVELKRDHLLASERAFLHGRASIFGFSCSQLNKFELVHLKLSVVVECQVSERLLVPKRKFGPLSARE